MPKLNGLFFTILQDNESFFYFPKSMNEYYIEEMREVIEQFEYMNKGLIQYQESNCYYDTYHKTNQLDNKEEKHSLFLIISSEASYPETFVKELCEEIGVSFINSEWFKSSNLLHKDIMQYIQREYRKYESTEFLNMHEEQIDVQYKGKIDLNDDLDVSLSYKFRRSSVRSSSMYLPNESFSNEMKVDINGTLTPLALHQNYMNISHSFLIKENENDEIAYWGHAKLIMAIINIVLLIILMIVFIIMMLYLI